MLIKLASETFKKFECEIHSILNCKSRVRKKNKKKMSYLYFVSVQLIPSFTCATPCYMVALDLCVSFLGSVCLPLCYSDPAPKH